MNALTLFDAAVKNCGQIFHQLFTSRATMTALVEIVDDTRTENSVRNRIGALLKQWMEDPEFKDKAQYAMLGATYKKLTTEKGYTFIDGSYSQPISSAAASAPTATVRKAQDELLAKREEEEFARASKYSRKKKLTKILMCSIIYSNFVLFKLLYQCKKQINQNLINQLIIRSIHPCNHRFHQI